MWGQSSGLDLTALSQKKLIRIRTLPDLATTPANFEADLTRPDYFGPQNFVGI